MVKHLFVQNPLCHSAQQTFRSFGLGKHHNLGLTKITTDKLKIQPIGMQQTKRHCIGFRGLCHFKYPVGAYFTALQHLGGYIVIRRVL